MRLRMALLVAAALLPAPLPCPAAPRPAFQDPACGLCCTRPPTLREVMSGAHIIVVGSLARPAPPNPAAEGAQGVTDLVVEKSLKTHPDFARQKVLTIHLCVPPNKSGGNRYL